jgi:mannose-6-phosphate isomerase-like protein (cupin superfamily)
VTQLYQRIPPYFSQSDARGAITGVLNFGAWAEVNLITSVADTVRGRHYHKHTEECFLILSGRIKVTFRKPESEADLTEETVFTAGDVFRVFPFVEHTFEILEDAQWINLLSRPIDKNDPDFHRYPE